MPVGNMAGWSLALIGLSFLVVGCAAAKRPDNLGVKDGQLAPCPNSPNCVSSQESRDGKKVEPIALGNDADAGWTRLKRVVIGMDRVTVIADESDYLHVEFRTKLMKFVDDVELYRAPGAKVTHIRSASREGYSDLGVNKKRVKAIQKAFKGS